MKDTQSPPDLSRICLLSGVAKAKMINNKKKITKRKKKKKKETKKNKR